VQDLRSILPPEMRVLYADMKFSLHDFPATLRELCAQAGVYDAEVPNVGKLIMALAKKSQPTLLILHNLDLLRDSPHDPLFDTELLPHLVAFSGHAHLSLLTVSEDIYPDWALPCKHIAIPLLEKNGDT